MTLLLFWCLTNLICWTIAFSNPIKFKENRSAGEHKSKTYITYMYTKESVCDPIVYDDIFRTFSLYIFVFYFTSTWKTQHNNINRKVSPVIFQRIFHHLINNVWYNIRANKPITVTTLSNKLVILFALIKLFSSVSVSCFYMTKNKRYIYEYDIHFLKWSHVTKLLKV